MEFSNIIDLSHRIYNGMQVFPTKHHCKVKITQLANHQVNGKETRQIQIGTHSGTHCDAPSHYVRDSITIDKIPVRSLIGTAAICDLTMLPPSHCVEINDIIANTESKFYKRLILRFDWAKYYGTDGFYVNHPYLSNEAANWLLNEGCVLLGMDTPQPDNSDRQDSKAPIHQILLSKHVILLEYLSNLESIKLFEALPKRPYL